MTSYAARIFTGRSHAVRVVLAALMLGAAGARVGVAQEGADPEGEGAGDGMTIGALLGIGVEHIPDDDGGGATWQSLTLAPELSAGKFSLDLGAQLRFRFDGGPAGSEWEIREEDWSPDESIAGRSFLDLFLPIIRHARYGGDGEPLVVRAGSFEDATLGTGFLLGEYANTALLPGRRLFGVDLDIDGAVFNVPVAGLETVVGHVPALDVMGARLWARPMYALSMPLLSSLRIGAVAAADFDPFRYDPDTDEEGSVSAFGFDLEVPVVATPSFAATAHGDVVLLGTSEIDSRSVGTAVGLSGTALSNLRYGLQLRLTDDRFLPVYFDRDYDRQRADKFRALRAAERATTQSDALEGLVHAGWAARVGASLLDRRIDLDLGLSGPLSGASGALAEVPYAQRNGLDVKGRVALRDLGVDGMSFDLDYRKRQLDSLRDLTEPEHLSLGTALSYRTNGTLIILSYRGHYDPAADGLVGAPAVESWIELF